MRRTAPLDVSRRFFEEVWNNRRLDVIEELFTESSITIQLRGAPEPVAAAPRRPSDLKREITAWFESFPDIRFEIEHEIETGDKVVTAETRPLNGTVDFPVGRSETPERWTSARGRALR